MIRFAMLCILAAVPVLSALAQTTAHDKGPGGLEAWTDDHHTREFRTNTESFGIVIARNGKVVRRIGDHDGGPFFWNLMLLPDGKRIGYESGPFHFAMTCTLMDIATGKHLQDYDCFSTDSVDNGPQWVKDLLAVDRTPPAGTPPAAQTLARMCTGEVPLRAEGPRCKSLGRSPRLRPIGGGGLKARVVRAWGGAPGRGSLQLRAEGPRYAQPSPTQIVLRMRRRTC